MARRERAQADRRQQPRSHDVEHRLPAARARAPDGAARWRRAGSAGRRRRRRARRRRRRRGSRRRRTRSARLNDSSRALGARSVSGGSRRRRLSSRDPACQQAQRVVPQRVDLDRLAAPRRHHPVVDLGVHPGQLVALGALAQQAVGRIDADAEARAARGGARRCRRSVGSSCAQRRAVAGRRRGSGRARGRTTASRRRCGRGLRCSPSGNRFGIRPSRTCWAKVRRM